ncbi:MAG: TolC family protein, partial [Myxococcales bacterium]|nr:TolC family protein [Myxococcales bacterium]
MARSRLTDLALAMTALTSACNPLHDARRPDAVTPTVTAPERFTGASGGVAAPDRWWTSFGDAELNAHIDRLLAGSLDLRQAWARLRQANAVAEQAGAARLPSLDATASMSRSQSRELLQDSSGATAGPPGVPAAFGGTPTGTVTTDTIGLSLAASYEVDLWGRVSGTARAAAYEAEAAELDVEATAMTLAAQVAELWFLLAEVTETERLLRAQLETNETLLDLQRFRFGNGLATALDVLQQEQQTLATKRQLP